MLQLNSWFEERPQSRPLFYKNNIEVDYNEASGIIVEVLRIHVQMFDTKHIVIVFEKIEFDYGHFRKP